MANEENLKPFSKDKQPSDEARKKGWEKRKLKTRLKGPIAKYLNMSIGEFNQIQKDALANPEKYLMLDAAAINYVAKMTKDYKYIFDHIDRVSGKAIMKQEIVADIDTTLSGEVDINEKINVELSDDKAATILSILAQSGALKPGDKISAKSETDGVDKDSSNI